MSKTLKNVVNPDDVTARYGADSLRLYEMFLGPLEMVKPWDDKGIKGVFGFLSRAFRFISAPESIVTGEEDREVLKGIHQTIRKVESDITNLRFNTAISAMMIFLNLATKKGRITIKTAEAFIKILSPFAPHLAEELWQATGHRETVSYEPWPLVNEEYLKEEVFEYPVSFNGKMRFKLELPVDMPKEEIIQTVISDERSQKWLGGKEPANIVVVPNRIINIVIK
jgi:leucyl-tRNA synthetase